MAIFDSELVSRFEWFRTKPQGPATPPVFMVLWQDVVTRGYEGPVAKDPVSPYVAGCTLKWLKVKQPNYREQERGWEPSRKS